MLRRRHSTQGPGVHGPLSLVGRYIYRIARARANTTEKPETISRAAPDSKYHIFAAGIHLFNELATSNDIVAGPAKQIRIIVSSTSIE